MQHTLNMWLKPDWKVVTFQENIKYNNLTTIQWQKNEKGSALR